MKFTRAEIAEQVASYQTLTFDCDELPVVEAWFNLADKWLSDGDNDYQSDGFKGFDQRALNDILVDFHLNDLLVEPLTDEEFNSFCMGSAENVVVSISEASSVALWCFDRPGPEQSAAVEEVAKLVADRLDRQKIENLLDILNTAMCIIKG